MNKTFSVYFVLTAAAIVFCPAWSNAVLILILNGALDRSEQVALAFPSGIIAGTVVQYRSQLLKIAVASLHQSSNERVTVTAWFG